MDHLYEPKEQERVANARESFSGRPLSNAHFDNAIAITAIIERKIHRNGAFVDDLRDYAYAFARTEAIEPVRAETIIRDLFKARTGRTMNEMRETLAERESKLTRAQTGQAYDSALAVGKMIEEGDKISFQRAFNHQAAELAGHMRITDACAKRLMKEEFAAAEADLDFYAWGKDIEERFYRPQIEAEKQKAENRAREGERTRSPDRSRDDAAAGERGPDRKTASSWKRASRQPSEGEPARGADRSRSRVGPRP